MIKKYFHLALVAQKFSQGGKSMNLTGTKDATHRRNKLRNAICISALALFASVGPALATINNTVTVKGTPPGGPVDSVTSSTTKAVDVVNSAPTIALVKSWVFAPGGDVNGNGLADAGDKIVYSYLVTNTGNVTLDQVAIADVHQGVGAPLTILTPTAVTTDNGTAAAGTLNDSVDNALVNDGNWDKLGPGDVITFTSTYTVVPGDLTAPTSADGLLDSTATATGTYTGNPPPVPVSATSSTAVPLHVAPALLVSKTATPDTNVPAGTLVTYTYTVSNSGNVPITNVTLADTHNGVPGALTPAFQSFTTNTGSTNAGNTITLLQPGDVATFTATYTVTQNDVDTRQ
jgi:large repetitive protein